MFSVCFVCCRSLLYDLGLVMSTYYYAVGKGRNPGVYHCWKDCQKEVANVQNAKFRKFVTEEEAINFVKQCQEGSHSPLKYINKSCTQISPASQTSPSFSRNVTVDKYMPGSMSQTSTNTTAVNKLQERLNQVEESQEETAAKVLSELQEIRIKFETLNERLCTTSEEIGQIVVKLNTLEENFDLSTVKLRTELRQLKTDINSLKFNWNDKLGLPSTSCKRNLTQLIQFPATQNKRKYSSHSSSYGDDVNSEESVECLGIHPRKVTKVELDSEPQQEFQFDIDGYVIVYTDGACENNGRNGAKAGIGVWFGDNHPLNISEPVQGRPTNNNAEIQAATYAVEVAKKAGVKKLLINTDSQFMINCITKWIHKWKKNKWVVGTGQPVKNKEELMVLDEALEGINVKWNHVRGHHGIHGNEMADDLARAGAKRYK